MLVLTAASRDAEGRAKVKSGGHLYDYSAEVVLHGDSNFNDTIAKVSEIVCRNRRPHFSSPRRSKSLPGRGTIGLEVWKIWRDVDNVIVPIGGGGLIAGIAIAIKSINNRKVIGVQAENVLTWRRLITPAK